MPTPHAASAQLLDRLRSRPSFQISVDTDRLALGLEVAAAALRAGITIIEMGTPLLKCEGVYNVVPAFRRRFPGALLLADMKTMDGGGHEARAVFEGGANIIDFLALAGVATARGICAVRDDYRAAEAEVPRLVFADLLLPPQGPAERAIEAALAMLEAGVDGVGVHLQADARRADPALGPSGYLAEIAARVHERVGATASVQVVGGLSLEQAQGLAARGLKAFVISANLGVADGAVRYGLPAAEIEGHIGRFIREVGG
jgi:3-keto-L-gulonate-6-phosphate decarboxylase